jgi:hypothetical protein
VPSAYGLHLPGGLPEPVAGPSAMDGAVRIEPRSIARRATSIVGVALWRCPEQQAIAQLSSVTSAFASTRPVAMYCTRLVSIEPLGT